MQNEDSLKPESDKLPLTDSTSANKATSPPPSHQQRHPHPLAAIRPRIILPYAIIATLTAALGLVITTTTSQLSSAILYTTGTLLVTIVGFTIAQLIVQRVPPPTLPHKLNPEGHPTPDESVIMAESFDTMSQHLEERTVALQREVARVNAILTSIADGVVVRDSEGHVIMMNDAARAMLANSRGFEHSPLAATNPAEDELSSLGNGQVHISQRVELADRVVSTRTATVRTLRGELAGNVIVMRDVTREAAAERLKDDFINQISHELRTPLTVIKGYADVLKIGKDNLAPEKYRKAMDAIFSHSRSLERMIKQLIDLSEMASGSLQLQKAPTDIVELLEVTLQDWAPAFKESGLIPKINIEPEQLIINADPKRLRWALDSVLLNTCQYSPHGGDLNINMTRMENAAIIQIRDQGTGISGEELPHVFKRFYRGTPVDTDGNLLDVRGLGQGLYVLQSVLERHDGRVWVTSEVGKGSEFTILLPLALSNDE